MLSPSFLLLGWILFSPLSLPVIAHSAPRNIHGVTEIQLPQLTLRPQATGFTFDLEAALPPASSTLSQLSSLPTTCGEYLGPGNECVSNMTATAVTYEDCGDPFTICRCGDAEMAMDTAVDRLGRVPVGLRRFIATVLILQNVTARAYTNLSTGDIHLFGDCAMDTWIHEAIHTFDFRLGSQSSALSSSQEWLQAIASDSCVPDTYSLTNEVEAKFPEDFAQMSVIKVYLLLHNNHLPPMPGFRADCMSHQLDFMGTLPLYNATSLFGNTCSLPASGGRHSRLPAVLDANRAFKTVSLDPPVGTSVAKNSAPCREPKTPWILKLILRVLM
ncbi:hypothetical protein B0H17DRAFT_1206183 [Mycena rosella]|uniref:Uncharacterized protein n=1 Tax=Mycena rosella TaxID=1033263 RepID=A0AAD7D5X7_MYCRO|nr:hypothetical protein B0H17DRAFT_1206183 [Mycena rosella]